LSSASGQLAYYFTDDKSPTSAYLFYSTIYVGELLRVRCGQKEGQHGMEVAKVLKDQHRDARLKNKIQKRASFSWLHVQNSSCIGRYFLSIGHEDSN